MITKQKNQNKKKVFPESQRDFSAEIRHSNTFSGRNQKFKRFFRLKTYDFQKIKKIKVFTEIQRDFSAEIRHSNTFSGRNQKFKRFFRLKTGDLQKKKVFIPKNFVKSNVSPTKITKIRMTNTNLGLDLHSSSPDPVNFFGAQ